MSSISPRSAHIGAASLNQTVGDWQGNRRRITEVIQSARASSVRLLVLPEMCIPGYSLGDRLLRRGTLDRSWQMLEELATETGHMVVAFGLPVRHRGVVYNVIAVVAHRRIVGLVAKEYMAVGDVQYENRWYQSWPHGVVEEFTTPDGETLPIGTLVFQARGLGRFAFEICEDGWKGIRPGSIYALAGAETICNPSASWMVLGKHAIRRRMVEQISQEDHCCYVYTSLLGCDSTRLVFDGSVLIGDNGDIAREGRRMLFRKDWELVDHIADLDALRLARMEEGSWREQVQAYGRGEMGASPRLIELDGDFVCDGRPQPPRPYWIPEPAPHPDPSLKWVEEHSGPLKHEDIPHLELELALALGLRDYVRKCGIRSITIALSGGRDSAMVATLVHRMQVYDGGGTQLITAYMATENSGDTTRHAAAKLAEAVGATHLDGNIQGAFDQHRAICEQMTGTPLTWEDHDIPLQNVQARLRGSLIWMVANLNNSLLLATSNKSEAAVGYTTMDGDTSGGLAPIADVPKSLVSLWLRWAERFHGLQALHYVNKQEPTAELRPPDQEQTDEGDLMPFHVLDQLMYAFVQLGQDPIEMFDTLWPAFESEYASPRDFAAHIEKFVTLFCRAQWKRERFAISFRVTAFDLDPKTGFRFPPVQAPFTEELAELRAYVETR